MTKPKPFPTIQTPQKSEILWHLTPNHGNPLGDTNLSARQL